MSEKIAHLIGPSRIDLAYEQLGDPEDPALLLIMGLGAQLVHWPAGFLQALIARRLHVIRFDNRDAGRSTHFPDGPAPDFSAALSGDFSSAPYALSDMAADAVGLLDYLGLDAAHAVGASMGGAIAQVMAIEHPDRVLSLTSIMSSTGAASVGLTHPETGQKVFGGPPVTTRAEVIERAARIAPIVRSPRYPTPIEEITHTAGLAWDRDHDETAFARQGIASLASGDRTASLRGLSVPALIIHGTDDPMCDVSGGRATAAAIPGAELMLIEGMGHDLPRPLWDSIADRIAVLVRRAEAGTERGAATNATS